MKTILSVLGVIFLVLVGLVVASVIFANSSGTKLDAESKLYVDEAISAIAGSWDTQEVFERSSPELLEVAPRDEVERLFQIFSERLGPMKEYQGSQGEANIFMDVKNGKIITAAYQARAEFENGPATIEIRTILNPEGWKILKFNVNSPALIQ